MQLHELPSIKNSKRKRVGRGPGSNWGQTCGKGQKGQKSRAGYSSKRGFEGGQMPLARRLPKKGFNNAQFKTNFAIVNVSDLEEKFSDGDDVNEESLRACGLVKGVCDAIKVLGSGDLSKKLTVTADKLSATAREKIEKAGGSIAE